MIHFNDSATWFLAQLKPNCAAIADRNLKRQGFQTFLPFEEIGAQKRGKFILSQQPLFPGYIFVAFNTAMGGWASVNSTYGITRLVSFGREPAQVPKGLISELVMRCDTNGKILPPAALQFGDQVQLTSGPFANFLATVEKISPDKRVWVLMDVMGGGNAYLG
jgi:transcriptional antiterminator RfaH